jgi:hypothetical protein
MPTHKVFDLLIPLHAANVRAIAAIVLCPVRAARMKSPEPDFTLQANPDSLLSRAEGGMFHA